MRVFGALLLCLSLTGCAGVPEVDPYIERSLVGIAAQADISANHNLRLAVAPPPIASQPSSITNHASYRLRFAEPSIPPVSRPVDASVCALKPCTFGQASDVATSFLAKFDVDDVVYGFDTAGFWLVGPKIRINPDYSALKGECKRAVDFRANCLPDHWTFTFRSKCILTRYVVLDVATMPASTSPKGENYDRLREGMRRLPESFRRIKIDPAQFSVTWLEYIERTCANNQTVLLRPEKGEIDRTGVFGLGLNTQGQ